MDMTEAIASELRARVAVARLRASDLFKPAGVSRSTYVRHMNGDREISVPTFVDYCDVLGANPGEVIEGARARQAAGIDEHGDVHPDAVPPVAFLGVDG